MEYKQALRLMGRLYTLHSLAAELLDLPEGDVRGRYRVYRQLSREIGLCLASIRRLV